MPAVESRPAFVQEKAKLLEKELHIPVIERSIARTELYQADEVFLVGTGAEVAPVKEIDGRKIGKGTIGDVTGKLKKMYFAITHGEQSSYMHFVTQVTVRS
jgi:branched-chain amino acid aminotransferase